MVNGLLGKKLGMTQVFDEDGRVRPVTVLQVGPCVVVQVKTIQNEGYQAVQLGLVESLPAKANRPMDGHFNRAGVPPTRILREFSLRQEEEEGAALKLGDHVGVNDVFTVGGLVDVGAKSIGRGFQGVMKRHGYHGGRASHGSMFHRAPGSIGASASPSRVYPGTKLPGQMGGKLIRTRRLRIVKIDEENNLMLVKGAVPGSKQTYVTLTRSL